MSLIVTCESEEESLPCYWTEENKEEAELALKGEYYKTREKLAKQRIKL